MKPMASSMVVEDHLKTIVSRTNNRPWKATNDKCLPRVQHSCFGDFPATHINKKPLVVEPMPATNTAEQSIAATGTGK